MSFLHSLRFPEKNGRILFSVFTIFAKSGRPSPKNGCGQNMVLPAPALLLHKKMSDVTEKSVPSDIFKHCIELLQFCEIFNGTYHLAGVRVFIVIP